MNTETLKTFILLTKIKNYTQTADKLYVAQSTVTNRIFELEKELGQTLFLRTPKNLTLTPKGEQFLSYALRIIELEETAKEKLSANNIYEDSLKIGTTNTIYDCHLLALTLDFIQKNPKIKLTITINHSQTLIDMLQDNILDVIFSYIPYKKHGIICTDFYSDEVVLVTNPLNTSYIDGVTQKDLCELSYIYCDFTFSDIGSYIKELFPKDHPFPLELDKGSYIIPYLLSGNNYSFLPKSLITPYIEKNKLIIIPLHDFILPKIQSYVLTKHKIQENDIIYNYIYNL